MPKPEAPVDELTHYPLSFFPSSDLPPVPKLGEDYDRTLTDFHHSVFRRADIMAFGIGGAAARDSRIQWSWRAQHLAFHEAWGGLDEHLPDTPVRQYRAAFFGLARYIPRQGISFSKGKPLVETMDRWQYDYLRRSGQLMVGNDGARARRFLLDYSVQTGLSAVSQKLLDEFLDLSTTSRRPERVRILADTLLQQTIDPIVTPGMRQIYAYTKKHEMLRPGLPRGLTGLIRREIIAAFPGGKLSKVLASKFAMLRLGGVAA
ncbi:MAG TPA: hypothetical protein VFB59_03770 [Candidatus Saccharimonadales bacterium]|nr:hypothetical protein [Candidatus Saccharimonadales bacterium]